MYFFEKSWQANAWCWGRHVHLQKRVWQKAGAFLVASALTACGGGGGGGSGADGGISQGSTAPVFVAQPVSVTVYESEATNFQVLATGASTLTYQWKKNGKELAGETSDQLRIKAAAMADNGVLYSVEVSGPGGTTTSAKAKLTVLSASPQVVTSPAPQHVVADHVAKFSVTASGRPPLNYQWRKNGQDIAGAKSANYSEPVAVGDHDNQYTVVVSNDLGRVTSNIAKLSVQKPLLNDLVISEVSTCNAASLNCWFEIYNPTSTPIDLSAYSVRVSSAHVTTNESSVKTYGLPKVLVGADAYVVISGNANNATTRGTQIVKLNNEGIVPRWAANGFVELLKDDVTRDFVKFGTETQMPVTAEKWKNAAVKAMLSSDSDRGKSIVRPYPRTTDTNTGSAADWVAVDWATPGGRNDVPAGAEDADADGIPDASEMPGGSFAGLDLYAMGARTGQKDIFIEVDHMQSTDPGVIPREDSLRKVVESFAANGIRVHFDAGRIFSSEFSAARFNLGQSNHVVPYEKCVAFTQFNPCPFNSTTRRTIYDWKEESMELRRQSIFHYLLFANSLNNDGSAGGPTGVAELIGNDLIVSMGGVFLTAMDSLRENLLTNMQAATVMHELGHNLGLRHGGDEHTNFKPNYWSVMNYMYQLSGLDPDPTAITAYQRWSHARGDRQTPLCNLVGSPCGDPSQFIIDYSNGSGKPLNETQLIEADNVGRGANAGAYADWNGNFGEDKGTQAMDLNGDGRRSLLTDANDWRNLVFPFYRREGGSFGLSRVAETPKRLTPVSEDRQETIDEKPLSPALLQEIRSQ